LNPLLQNQTCSLPLVQQSKKLKPGQVIFWEKQDVLVLRKVNGKYKTLSMLKKMFSNSLKFPP
jgi:hypothetical protein